MSIDYRFYCHDCKVRTTTVGNWRGFFNDHEELVYDFLTDHIGHSIEFSDFAKKAGCKGTCYDTKNCEGDCYEEVLDKQNPSV